VHLEGFGTASGKKAIEKFADLAKEREKTRRITLIVAAAFLIFGCSALLYCPNDKKMEGIIVGAVMIVLSLGAVGVSAFRVKLPYVEINSLISSADKQEGSSPLM
jgi:protein-S-isoprenylcysteine O-methyltransferase Ste14